MSVSNPDHGRQIRFSLLCNVGRHKTDPLAHWNDGYYFSRCRRCGRDLVRTAFGRWTVPKGYRVVWAAEPPQKSKPVQLIRAGDVADRGLAVDARPRQSIEFPIRETAEATPQPPRESEPNPELQHGAVEAADIQQSVEDASSGSSVPDEPAGKSEVRSDDGNDVRPVGIAAPAQVASDSRLPSPDMLRSPQGEGAQAAEPVVTDTMSAAALPDNSDEQPVGSPSTNGIEQNSASQKDEAAGQVDDPEPVPESQVPPQDAVKPLPLIPDFMDGGTLAVPYDLRTGALLRPIAPERDGQVRPERTLDQEDVDGFGQRTRRINRRDRRSGSDPSPPDRGDSRKHRSTFIERQGGVMAAAVFGGLVLAAALIDNNGSDAARNVYRAMPAAPMPVRRAEPGITPVSPVVPVSPFPVAAEPVAPEPVVDAVDPAAERVSPVAPPASPIPGAVPVPASAPGDDRAYVTASLLNCRAVPSDGAATVRRLMRGAAVRVLGVDPGWINISHGGQRCWASAEFISTTRPI